MNRYVKMERFNNGQEYPMLGLCADEDSIIELTSSEEKECKQTKIYETVKSAIDLGYRHFDCAPFYNNEISVGRAIAEKIREGVIKREDVFITSKLWNDKLNPDIEVEVSLTSSLRELGLDYLDLYLIHWPSATTKDRNTTDSEGRLLCSDIWNSMEQCVHLGFTKSIGLSNFNITQVKDILEIATIKPVVNQIELHPYLTQNELKKFCQSNGILLTACEPLGVPYHFGASTSLLEYYVVNPVARKYNKSNPQIIIRFQIQRGIIAILKSTELWYLMENFEVWDFELDEEDMDILEKFYLNFHDKSVDDDNNEGEEVGDEDENAREGDRGDGHGGLGGFLLNANRFPIEQ